MGANVKEAVLGPWPDQATEVRMNKLHANLDVFSEGRKVVVARGRESTCLFKQLDPIGHEVWEIRSVDPRPSLRLFGAFAITDVFVALHIYRRDELGGPESRQWRDAIVRFKAEWRRLFLSYPRHSGETLDAYFSENAIDLGKFG